MKIASKILKSIGIILLSFIGLLVGYLIISLILSWITVKQELETKPEISIYILTNGVHTDIVVPVKSDQIDWSKEVKFTNTLSKDSTYNYIGFGWGDKDFYLNTPEWADLKLSIAFKATFGFGESAMHTTFFKNMIEDEHCKHIEISKEQYLRLIQYIKASFKSNNDGNILLIPTNVVYGDSDNFYEGIGSYSMIHTCNSWVNAGLKSCGQKACLWTPFGFGIFYHYK